MDELIDVLDESGNKTGVVKNKLDVKKAGDWHRAISVCIVNNNFEILMHQRSSKKTIFPSLWSLFVKGHVASKENSIETCIRECYEELGIKLEKTDLKYLHTLKDKDSNPKLDFINNIFYDNYIVFKDIKLEDVVMQEDEVAQIKYMYFSDVEKLIKCNDLTLVPNYKEYKILLEYLNKLK